MTNKTTEPTALAGIEPVAWMTHHDEPMLFPIKEEAYQYCADDENPIALYSAATVERLVQEREGLNQLAELMQKSLEGDTNRIGELLDQLAASQAHVEDLITACKEWEQRNFKHWTALIESQAREQQLREALELVKRDAWHDIPHYAFGDNEAACEMNRLLENIEGYGDEALALPQDDTALRQWGAKLLKPALHAINEWADTFHNAIWHIQNIRDGIATPDAALANLKECQEHCEAEWDVVRSKADELEGKL